MAGRRIRDPPTRMSSWAGAMSSPSHPTRRHDATAAPTRPAVPGCGRERGPPVRPHRPHREYRYPPPSPRTGVLSRVRTLQPSHILRSALLPTRTRPSRQPYPIHPDPRGWYPALPGLSSQRRDALSESRVLPSRSGQPDPTGGPDPLADPSLDAHPDSARCPALWILWDRGRSLLDPGSGLGSVALDPPACSVRSRG